MLLSEAWGKYQSDNGTSLALAIETGAGLSFIGARAVVGLAVGAGIGFDFEFVYNHNLGGFQETLDKAGEAIASGLSKMNPVN